MQPRVGVGVVICRDGKFLVGLRKGSHGAHTWSIPGGHLEYGETPDQTAAREVKEETGLVVSNLQFCAITNDIFEADKKHYVTIWMIGDWVSGESQITEPNKFIEQRWVDFNSLPSPLFLPWRQLLVSDFLPAIKKQLSSSKL